MAVTSPPGSARLTQFPPVFAFSGDVKFRFCKLPTLLGEGICQFIGQNLIGRIKTKRLWLCREIQFLNAYTRAGDTPKFAGKHGQRDEETVKSNFHEKFRVWFISLG